MKQKNDIIWYLRHFQGPKRRHLWWHYWEDSGTPLVSTRRLTSTVWTWVCINVSLTHLYREEVIIPFLSCFVVHRIWLNHGTVAPHQSMREALDAVPKSCYWPVAKECLGRHKSSKKIINSRLKHDAPFKLLVLPKKDVPRSGELLVSFNRSKANTCGAPGPPMPTIWLFKQSSWRCSFLWVFHSPPLSPHLTSL